MVDTSLRHFANFTLQSSQNEGFVQWSLCANVPNKDSCNSPGEWGERGIPSVSFLFLSNGTHQPQYPESYWLAFFFSPTFLYPPPISPQSAKHPQLQIKSINENMVSLVPLERLTPNISTFVSILFLLLPHSQLFCIKIQLQTEVPFKRICYGWMALPKVRLAKHLHRCVRVGCFSGDTISILVMVIYFHLFKKIIAYYFNCKNNSLLK